MSDDLAHTIRVHLTEAQVWWCEPVINTTRQRQEDRYEFAASLIFIQRLWWQDGDGR